MSTFEINSEALDAAHRAMTGICDTIEAQRAQHSHAHSGIEGMLANAAAVVLAATGLDPFSIWEQWGFGGVAQTCSATNWTVEQVRGTIQQIVGEVSEAHRGELAPVLYDRAMGLRSALDNAQERLRSITSLLHPGNLLQLLTSPWTILDHFSAASGALNLAHSLAQDYRDFLARLSAREKDLIEEIITLLAIPEVGLVPAGIAIWSEVTGGNSNSPHPAPTPPTQAPQEAPEANRINPPGSPDKYAATPEAAILAWAEYYKKQKNYYSQQYDARRGEWSDTNGYGFDCSGFVYKVFHDSGNGDLLKGDTLSHPHDASILANEYKSGTAVAITSLNGPAPKGIVPGSLVFFKDKSDTADTPVHVAIVESVGSTVGAIKVIGATYPGHGVDSYSIADFANSSIEPETAMRFVTFN